MTKIQRVASLTQQAAQNRRTSEPLPRETFGGKLVQAKHDLQDGLRKLREA